MTQLHRGCYKKTGNFVIFAGQNARAGNFQKIKLVSVLKMGSVFCLFWASIIRCIKEICDNYVDIWDFLRFCPIKL